MRVSGWSGARMRSFLLLLWLVHYLPPARGLSGPANVSLVACVPGGACPVLGACPAGSAPADTLCALCAPGTFAAALGSAECAPCPAGTAAPAYGSAACVPCRAGSAAGAGAASCSPCPPSMAAPLPGAPACSPCPPGSVPGPAGAAGIGAYSCTLCPLDTWSRSAGGSANAPVTCVPCPSGLLTAFAGSSSAGACLSPDDPLLSSTRFACPLPTQARASSSLTSPCQPLSCPAAWGLALSPDGSACVGCPAGKFGSLASGPAGCSAIPDGSASALYLPFTQPNPLFDFWPGRAAGKDPVVPPPAPPGPGSLPRCVFLNDTVSNAVPATVTRKSSVRAISAALFGGIVVAVLAGLFVVLSRFPLSTPSRWCHFIAILCPPCDQMPPAGALDHVFASCCGSGDASLTPRQRAAAYRAAMAPRNACERQCERWSPDLEEDDATPTGKGVVCTLMLAALLAMYCAYQLVRWQDSNLVEEGGTIPWDATLPFLSATGAPPARPAASIVGGVPGVSGVTLRFFVDGDAARCSRPLGIFDNAAGRAAVRTVSGSPAELLAAGAAAQGWVAAPVTSCGSAARSVSVITLFCPNCAFSRQSGVTLALDASCQSILMEAAAVRAYPQNTVGFLRAAVSAASADSILSSVTWTVSLLLHGVLDYYTDPPGTPIPIFRGGGNFTGYIPLTAALQSTLQPTSAVTARPSEAAPLLLTVNLPLENYIFLSTLSQRSELLDSVQTLMGTFPSVFGSALIYTVLTRMVLSVLCRPRGRSRRHPGAEEEGEEEEQGKGKGKETGSKGAEGARSGEEKRDSAAYSKGASNSGGRGAGGGEAGGGPSTFSTVNPLAGAEGGWARTPATKGAAGGGAAAAAGVEGGAARAPTSRSGAPYHHAAGEAEPLHVHHFEHSDIPTSPLAVAKMAASFGCSEAAVRAAAQALQQDELPEAWGYGYATDPGTGEAVIFSPNGSVEDPRDDFLKYLRVWLTHERESLPAGWIKSGNGLGEFWYEHEDGTTQWEVPK